MMGKEQSDVEPGDEVEEENSRDEGVLGRDQVEDQGADAGKCLAQTEAVLPEQFVLKEIIFRSVAAERFERHAEHEQRAIDGVTPHGPMRATGRINRHEQPEAEKKEGRDEHDLAEQENTIKTLRALRDHD